MVSKTFSLLSTDKIVSSIPRNGCVQYDLYRSASRSCIDPEPITADDNDNVSYDDMSLPARRSSKKDAQHAVVLQDALLCLIRHPIPSHPHPSARILERHPTKPRGIYRAPSFTNRVHYSYRYFAPPSIRLNWSLVG